jgi:hypothetical protein
VNPIHHSSGTVATRGVSRGEIKVDTKVDIKEVGTRGVIKGDIEDPEDIVAIRVAREDIADREDTEVKVVTGGKEVTGDREDSREEVLEIFHLHGSATGVKKWDIPPGCALLQPPFPNQLIPQLGGTTDRIRETCEP